MGLIWTNFRVVLSSWVWQCDMKSCVLHFWSPVAWKRETGRKIAKGAQTRKEGTEKGMKPNRREKVCLRCNHCRNAAILRWHSLETGRHVPAFPKWSRQQFVSVTELLHLLAAYWIKFSVGWMSPQKGWQSELSLDCGCPRLGYCALHWKMCWRRETSPCQARAGCLFRNGPSSQGLWVF